MLNERVQQNDSSLQQAVPNIMFGQNVTRDTFRLKPRLIVVLVQDKSISVIGISKLNKYENDIYHTRIESRRTMAVQLMTTTTVLYFTCNVSVVQ